MDELDIIKSLKEISGPAALGLTDDCAVFGEFCITKDILSEGVHFLPDDEPFNLARKAIRVNLSDLAAMGAEPFGVLIGACLSRANISDEWLQEFNKGLKTDIDEFDFQLLGGDTVFHDAPTVFSVTAIGKTSVPLLRSTAKAGDNIFVSGRIGDAYLGLKMKKEGVQSGEFVEKYELPTPRLELGQKLRGVATACMDISDGLLIDLNRLCEASGVAAEIESKQIPVAMDNILLDLISGGDDYELLFTSENDEVEGCHKIGKIVEGNGLKLDGEDVAPKGYEHKAES